MTVFEMGQPRITNLRGFQPQQFQILAIPEMGDAVIAYTCASQIELHQSRMAFEMGESRIGYLWGDEKGTGPLV